MKFLPDYKETAESHHQAVAQTPTPTDDLNRLFEEYMRGDSHTITAAEIPSINWDSDYVTVPGLNWDHKYGDESPLFPDEPLDQNVVATWWSETPEDNTPVYEPVNSSEPDPLRKAFKRHLHRHNLWQEIKAKVIPGSAHFRYDTEERFEAFKRRKEAKPQGVIRRLGNTVLGMAEKAPSTARQKIGNFVLRASHEVNQRTNELLERKEVRNSIVIGTLAVMAVTVASNFLEQKGVSTASLIPHAGSKGGASGASNALHFLPNKGADHHVTNYVSHLPHSTFEAPPIHFEIHAGGNLSQSVHATLANMGVKDPAGSTVRVVNYLQFQQGNSLNLVHGGDTFSLSSNAFQKLIN